MQKNNFDLFYILKIPSSLIVNNNLSLVLDYDKAKEDNQVVTLGDNQVLRFIRRINGKAYDRDKVRELQVQKGKLIHSTASYAEIKAVQDQINLLLFVPDLITVKVDTTNRDYLRICNDTFSVDITVANTEYHRQYKRLCAGAGQLRRNSAFFVNVDYYNELQQVMMCGLSEKKIGKINVAKFNAYYSLYTSAINQVTTPKFVVIPDYEYTLNNQTVDWIYTNEEDELDIETRTIDFNMNAFDGSGIISPEMATKWQEDLHLDYRPSAFITRAPFLKGLLSVFDFKKFAKEVAHKDTITDIYGEEHNIDEVDAILTKSQFKMAKYYKSLQEYMYYFTTYGHIFGVTRVNKKESDFLTPLNYQYIQSNFFTEDTIKELAKPTADWIDSINNNNQASVMMYLLGYHPDQTIDQIEQGSRDAIAKCLLYSKDILDDPYVSGKIRNQISAKIDQCKIGKIFIEGSYDFIIPDLYALCEWAFKMPVKGLLPKGALWSRRWVEKGATRVSIQRSPLVASAENQSLAVYSDDKCMEWYQYIVWGNILNIWDLTVISMSDADFDGDIAATSDNETLINAMDTTQPIITYDKQKAKEQKLNYHTLAKFDTKSFDSPIGSITNLASNIYAMLPNYPKESAEYKELWKRIKLLRRFQGD